MHLADILKEKTIEELKSFARANDIVGFSGLKKDDLVSLILIAVIDTEQLKRMFTRLSPSTKWILMLLAIDFKGHASLDALEAAIKEQYTHKTFRKAIGTLLDSPFFGLIFNESDQDICIIPEDIRSELQPLIDQYSEKHRRNGEYISSSSEESPEEIAAEAEEIEDAKEIELNIPKKLFPIADLMVYVDNATMKFYCEEHSLTKGGNKNQLIERILNSNPNFNELFDILFATPELQMIAKDLNLSKSGTKLELISKILEKLDLKMSESLKPEKESMKKILHLDELKQNISPTPKQSVILEEDKESEKIVEDLIYELDRLKPPKPTDEKNLQFFILGYLWGKFGNRFVKYEVTSFNKKQRLDISLWNKIIFEIKVTRSTTDIRNGIGQTVQYLSQFPQYKYAIIIVYDESEGQNMKSQFFYKQDKIYMIFY